MIKMKFDRRKKKATALFLIFLAFVAVTFAVIETMPPPKEPPEEDGTVPHMTPLVGNLALIACTTTMYIKTRRRLEVNR